MDIFSVLGLSSDILNWLLPLMIGILLLFFVVLTIILIYHWYRYGIRKVVAVEITTFYLIGSVALIGAMIISYFQII